MAEALAKSASQWVDNIDIHGDNTADTTKPEIALKESLKKDLRILWTRKIEGKITDVEYNRYSNVAKTIFEKHNISEIQKEYMKERNKTLKESSTLLGNLSNIISNAKENIIDKSARSIRNIGTKLSVEAEQLLDGNLIQGYTHGKGNYNISVKDFETKLLISRYTDLNTRELTSYLEYLLKNGKLNKKTLEEKFGSNMIGFMRVWSFKIQESYSIDKQARKTDEITMGTQIGNFLFGHEKAVEKVLDEIFRDKLGQENIQAATKIYKEALVADKNAFKNKNSKEKTREGDNQYQILIEKAYIVFGKNKNKEEFQKKFEGILKNGFSSFDAVFEMFGGDADISLFKKLIADVAIIEQKESQKIESDIQTYVLGIPFYNKKNFCSLSVTEQLAMAEKQNDSLLIQLITKQQKAKENFRGATTMAKSDVATTTALKSKSSGSSLNEIRRKIEITSKAEELKNILNTSSNRAIIQSLSGLGHVNDIDDVLKDASMRKMIIVNLQTKSQKTKEEVNLLGVLNVYIDLKENQYKELYKAVKNKTEEEYISLKKIGMIKSSIFAEDLIGPIKPGMTISQIDKKLNIELDKMSLISDNGNHKVIVDSIKEKLSTLPENGKYVPLEKIHGDICYVKREGNAYTVSVNGEEKKCSGDEEVKNTINVYKFFYDIGLQSVASSMDKFLATVQKGDSTYPAFDVRKGFDEKRQRILLRVADRIFNLNMTQEMSEKSTGAFLSDFTARLNTSVGQKKGYDASLTRQGILTETKAFNETGLTRLMAKDSTTTPFVSAL